MAELLILGTGDSESLDFWNTNYLIESSAGRLLIDCGATIKYALREQQLSLAEVDAVLVSHVHGDHVFGLERLGFESRYVFHKRCRLFLPPGLEKPLWEETLRGSMGYSSEGTNQLEDFFEVSPVEHGVVEFGDVRLELFPTPHTAGKPSYGFVVNDRVIVTSDTNVIDWLARDDSARTILHDCSLQQGNPAHATLWEIIDAYPEAVRRRIIATHYGDAIESFRSQLDAAGLSIGRQGQRIAL